MNNKSEIFVVKTLLFCLYAFFLAFIGTWIELFIGLFSRKFTNFGPTSMLVIAFLAFFTYVFGFFYYKRKVYLQKRRHKKDN